MGEWLIPWRSRGKSGAVSDNFLWRHGRLYVMDNHRLALWCWWQHLEESDHWHFTHVDRHYDALWQQFDPWPVHSQPIHRRDLGAFRSATITCAGDDDCELYRWDTITSALWSLHKESLLEVRFAGADEGDKPQIPRAQFYRPWSLPGLLQRVSAPAEHLEYPEILDIDLDYFTYHDLDGAFGRVYSRAYLRTLATAIRDGLANDRFGVVTIALSPETTGSWALAEDLLRMVLSEVDGMEDFLDGVPARGEADSA